MDFTEYIDPELFVTVPVLYLLGVMIKKSSINDKFIPLILGIVGILLALSYQTASLLPSTASEIASLIFASVTQGILCASCSVYANNLLKQLGKGNGNASFKDSEKGD